MRTYADEDETTEKNKLREILQYYVDTYQVDSDINDVYEELACNNVEVRGDSFYCEVRNEGSPLVLLAGTKDKADIWVLKKIISLIKSKETFLTLFNGNSKHLIERFSRFNLEVLKRDNDMSIIKFN